MSSGKAIPTLLENMGDIKGTIFDFKKAGDILAKHTHDESSAHISIVSRGRIKVYSHDWELEAYCGQVLNFPPNQPHEFMALEDDTRVVNIIKKYGGVQNEYAPVEPVQQEVLTRPIDLDLTVNSVML
jgi:quercetin dioxygenase-like cupin family protein